MGLVEASAQVAIVCCNACNAPAWQEYRRFNEKRVLARGSFGTAVLLECPKTGLQVVSKQIYSQFFDEASLKAVEAQVTDSAPTVSTVAPPRTLHRLHGR